jgi:hypothetical protein
LIHHLQLAFRVEQVELGELTLYLYHRLRKRRERPGCGEVVAYPAPALAGP